MRGENSSSVVIAFPNSWWSSFFSGMTRRETTVFDRAADQPSLFNLSVEETSIAVAVAAAIPQFYRTLN